MHIDDTDIGCRALDIDKLDKDIPRLKRLFCDKRIDAVSVHEITDDGDLSLLVLEKVSRREERRPERRERVCRLDPAQDIKGV